MYFMKIKNLGHRTNFDAPNIEKTEGNQLFYEFDGLILLLGVPIWQKIEKINFSDNHGHNI